MEIVTDLVQNQLILLVPVGLAIIGCILVFTYSIRPAQQPKFNLTALDDRKTAGKKKKLKEKKSPSNGQVSTGLAKAEKSPIKEKKKSPEPVKREKQDNNIKEIKKIDATKNSQEPKKKTNKKAQVEKPADFDDGNWETVPSKADKKKKTEQSPAKKEKKTKKQSTESEVTTKDEVQAKEEEKPVIEECQPVLEPEPVAEDSEKLAEESAPIIEEKKEKKKEKKGKKEVKGTNSIPAPEAGDEEQPVKLVPKVEKSAEKQENSSAPADASTGAVFDELGDTWTEAKTVKKSKKKSRRDN